jgi:hypothetical protein
MKEGNQVDNLKSDLSELSPLVWITKWVDYSKKYGLGYILNTNVIGVYFNDGSKMLSMDSDHQYKRVHYYYK